MGGKFGHADDYQGYNNNEEEQADNRDIKDNSENQFDDNGNLDADKYWQGENAIDAINAYIENLTESVSNVIAQISPNSAKYTEFEKKINQYISTDDENLNGFFKANDKIVNDARNKAIEDMKRYEQLKDKHNEEKAVFAGKVVKLAMTATPEQFKYLDKILPHYTICIDSENTTKMQAAIAYRDAVNKGDYNAVVDVYKRTYKESYDADINVGNNPLNEADTPADKAVVDVTAHYNYIKNELRDFMSEMFPIGKGDQIPGYTDAK